MHELMVGRIGHPVVDSVHRVLVDRLWPRGIAKGTAPWDTWLKDVAPSSLLRQWYGHDPSRYAEFRQRYWGELDSRPPDASVHELLAIWEHEPVILLTAAKNLELSHVPILHDFLMVSRG